MLRNVVIVSSITGITILNEYAKTQIVRTNVFKQALTQIKNQLSQINIKLEVSSNVEEVKLNNEKQSIQQKKNDKNIQKKEQQKLYDLVINPEIQKLLSTKSKSKVDFIKKLRDSKNQNIKTNFYMTLVHSAGAFVYTPFFYYSAISYCFISQVSLINDLYTLKTGKRMINVPFNTVGELYLKVSTVLLILFSIRSGLRKLGNLVQSKQIITKQP